MKLSIIIPVYKAEKWIGRCLDSIYGQAVPTEALEVVCVDDGSPDGSAGILRAYRESHPNLVLIEQENRGVAAARNRALEAARGEFVTFLDADDLFTPGSLGAVLRILEGCSDNLVVCRAFTGTREWFPWPRSVAGGKSYLPSRIVNGGFLKGSVWGCCYRSGFLREHGLRFPEGVSNGEDTFFFASCLYFADMVRFEDCRMCEIVEEEGSLTRSYSRERIEQTVASLAALKRVEESYPRIPEKAFVLQYMWYSVLSELVLNTIRTEGVGLRDLTQRGIRAYTRLKLDGNVLFRRGRMRLMRCSLPLFYFLSWCKNRV